MSKPKEQHRWTTINKTRHYWNGERYGCDLPRNLKTEENYSINDDTCKSCFNLWSEENDPEAGNGWGCLPGSKVHYRGGSVTVCGLYLTTKDKENWYKLYSKLTAPELCQSCLKIVLEKGGPMTDMTSDQKIAEPVNAILKSFQDMTKERDEALAKVKELEEQLKTYRKASEPLTWGEVKAAISPMNLKVAGARDKVWIGLLDEISSKFKHTYKRAALPEGGGSLQFRKEAIQDLKTVQVFAEDYLRVLKPVLDGLVNSQRLLASQDDSLQ